MSRAACAYRWRNASELLDATAIRYADDGAYDAFGGLDLLPDAPRKFAFDSAFARSDATYLTAAAARHIAASDGRLKAGACRSDAARAEERRELLSPHRQSEGQRSSAVEAAALEDSTSSASAVTAATLAPWVARSWWAAQRVGPFVSFGGGDRYQVSWADANELETPLQQAWALGYQMGIRAHAAGLHEILHRAAPPLCVGLYARWGLSLDN